MEVILCDIIFVIKFEFFLYGNLRENQRLARTGS